MHQAKLTPSIKISVCKGHPLETYIWYRIPSLSVYTKSLTKGTKRESTMLFPSGWTQYHTILPPSPIGVELPASFLELSKGKNKVPSPTKKCLIPPLMHPSIVLETEPVAFPLSLLSRTKLDASLRDSPQTLSAGAPLGEHFYQDRTLIKALFRSSFSQHS